MDAAQDWSRGAEQGFPVRPVGTEAVEGAHAAAPSQISSTRASTACRRAVKSMPTPTPAWARERTGAKPF